VRLVPRIVTVATAVCVASLIQVGTANAKRDKKIAPLTKEGLPNVQSDSAMVLNLEDGTVVYAKNPDRVRAIASTTKIFVALVARKKKIDLQGETEITEEDRGYAKGGARTRLPVGHKFKNIDLMRAMLVASDNRAPTAVARAAGMTPSELVDEMNTLAKDLGLAKTHFTDPSGLHGNESTAREMATALKAALEDDVIAEILATKSCSVTSIAKKPRSIYYRNTNKSLHRESNAVLGGKTGFTDKAGYCLLIAAEVNGVPMVMCFLGSKEKLTRFGDFSRVRNWVTTMLAPSDPDTGNAGAESASK